MKSLNAPKGVSQQAWEAYLRLRWLKPHDAERLIVKWSPSGLRMEFPWRVRLISPSKDVRAHGRTPEQAMAKALDRWDSGTNHIDFSDTEIEIEGAQWRCQSPNAVVSR